MEFDTTISRFLEWTRQNQLFQKLEQVTDIFNPIHLPIAASLLLHSSSAAAAVRSFVCLANADDLVPGKIPHSALHDLSLLN